MFLVPREIDSLASVSVLKIALQFLSSTVRKE